MTNGQTPDGQHATDRHAYPFPGDIEFAEDAAQEAFDDRRRTLAARRNPGQADRLADRDQPQLRYKRALEFAQPGPEQRFLENRLANLSAASDTGRTTRHD